VQPIFAALSRDGRGLIEMRTVEGNSDLWIIDIDRGTRRRLTYDPARDAVPVWSPVRPADDINLLRRNAATSAAPSVNQYRQGNASPGPPAAVTANRARHSMDILQAIASALDSADDRLVNTNGSPQGMFCVTCVR
jgi:hypothetical protein